jgi:putative ATPase
MSLALKYRPTRFDEMVGQAHLVGKGAILRAMVERGGLIHTFLYGPAGCGKTTLARVIANTLQRPFYELNATTLKVEELRHIFKTHHNTLERPLIFIDEVHRLSKNQQEVLLPFMENRSALIIGASTENPYFSLTSAVRSRSHLFELHPIEERSLERYLEYVLLQEQIHLNRETKAFLINSSNGDARAMLNLLESALGVGEEITLTQLQAIRPHAIQLGSAEAESHYDLSSAMIKSIRGSDIDAGLYYLARLIHGGEPPEFLARRLAILASEDIGNANPNALNLAASTLTIVKQIGYPEARIPLAQLVIYLASSPKSNSAYQAINQALKSIQEGAIYPTPEHIKPHAKTYQYPHDFNGWVAQSYLSTPIHLYRSSQQGFEKRLDEWLDRIKNR